MMYQKKKGLVMNGENLTKIHLIENKLVIKLSLAVITGKKGN